MSVPEYPPVPPGRPPGSGPRYETVLEQMAAWMRDLQAANAQHED